jgi:hypothetical protein
MGLQPKERDQAEFPTSAPWSRPGYDFRIGDGRPFAVAKGDTGPPRETDSRHPYFSGPTPTRPTPARRKVGVLN